MKIFHAKPRGNIDKNARFSTQRLQAPRESLKQLENEEEKTSGEKQNLARAYKSQKSMGERGGIKSRGKIFSKTTGKLPVQLNRKQYENLFERVLIIQRRASKRATPSLSLSPLKKSEEGERERERGDRRAHTEEK